ncbi:putative murein peptide carboxypeptidase [Waddlia chondrophila 2032/99]|uniref:Putative murein peptide carboxypeptidase n=1 Tax=Waddlia chondrophila 2032/99 TaxID=765953 RepID=F8LF39_9BACT|nr:putative murein peptide carboxypeptidase [Waddlia chondrophila 2032/99]
MKLFSTLICCLLCFPIWPAVAPPKLKQGDTIAIIAPASCPEENQDTVARGIKMLMQKGYKVKIAPNLMTRYGYLAGTDEERAQALMEAWIDPEVKAIWCWRGGFGCTRILDRIDFRVIRNNPKIFIGMSDITALHAAINKETGLITFLGPNLNSVFGKDWKSDHPYNEAELWKLITSDRLSPGGYLISMPNNYPAKDQNVMTLSPGIARGRLVGGTLSLVSSLVGTPWELDTSGKILVLEEVEEQPYRIDRMLSQLKLAGLLEQPAGVILCSWRGCSGKRPDKSLSLEHVFRDYFAHVRYPVLMGFPSGHVNDQATLPLNAMAELDATKKTLRILEEPVSQ